MVYNYLWYTPEKGPTTATLLYWLAATRKEILGQFTRRYHDKINDFVIYDFNPFNDNIHAVHFACTRYSITKCFVIRKLKTGGDATANIVDWHMKGQCEYVDVNMQL